MYTKEQFDKYIIEKYPDSELATVIAKDNENRFLDVCQKFLGIALNAPKIKTMIVNLLAFFYILI